MLNLAVDLRMSNSPAFGDPNHCAAGNLVIKRDQIVPGKLHTAMGSRPTDAWLVTSAMDIDIAGVGIDVARIGWLRNRGLNGYYDC